MKVLLANPRGFCAGVEMAIRSLEIVLDLVAEPVYVYHEIVHNREVVKRFEARGVTFVDEVAEVPRGATLVFSAHGVSPEVRQQARDRELRTIDATCPLVAKVHAEIVRFANLGYQIILIGHHGHDEVIGTLGESPEQTYLVQDEADVERLSFAANSKLAYLTQTTLSVDETRRIVDRLRERYPGIEGPPNADICYATQNRQTAVRALAGEADMIVVVGSENSSNSRRLYEVAVEHGAQSKLVDDDTQLDESWFSADQIVAVTAGASAPEACVQSVVQWLRSRFPVEVVFWGSDEPPRIFPLPSELQELQAVVRE